MRDWHSLQRPAPRQRRRLKPEGRILKGREREEAALIAKAEAKSKAMAEEERAAMELAEARKKETLARVKARAEKKAALAKDRGSMLWPRPKPSAARLQ